MNDTDRILSAVDGLRSDVKELGGKVDATREEAASTRTEVENVRKYVEAVDSRQERNDEARRSEIAKLDRRTTSLEGGYGKCIARRRAETEATGTHTPVAKRNSDPAELKVEREKTRRARLKLAALVLGVLAGGSAGTMGLQQLFSPAQASPPQPAATTIEATSPAPSASH